MGKYTKNTLIKEAVEDQRFIQILNECCPSITNHPRFIEGLDFTFQLVR